MCVCVRAWIYTARVFLFLHVLLINVMNVHIIPMIWLHMLYIFNQHRSSGLVLLSCDSHAKAVQSCEK